VKRGVAERELRAEHPVHPAREAQRGIVRKHVRAPDEDGAMPSCDAQLLVTQDDVTAVSLSCREE